MAESNIGLEVMSKPLPEVLNDIANLIKEAIKLKTLMDTSLAEAKEAVQVAIDKAVQDLMDGTIVPISQDIKDLKALLNSNLEEIQKAINNLGKVDEANSRAAKLAMDAAVAAANTAKSARDAYNALQAEHNDFVDKFNKQNGTIKDLSDRLLAAEADIRHMAVTEINSNVNKANYLKSQYGKHLAPETPKT